MDADRVTCINTGDYTFSLVLNAVYETVPDNVAAKHRLVRVIDESGEDYLYPEAYFVSAEVVAKTPGLEVRAPA